jgi:exopolysaccharide biosynthesis polyprenyl glycosylphosphotransferase
MTSVAQSAVQGAEDARLVAAAPPLPVPVDRRRDLRPGADLAQACGLLATLTVFLTAVGATTTSAAALAVASVWTGTHAIARAASSRKAYLGTGFVAVTGAFVGLAFASLIGVWLPGLALAPASLLQTAGAACLVSVCLQLVVDRGQRPRRILFAGEGDAVAELVAELREDPEGPYEFVGVVSDDDSAGSDWLGSSAELGAIAAREQPDFVVLADTAGRDAAVDLLLDVRSPRFRIVPLSHFYEYAFGRVPVQHLSPMWFVSLLHLYRRPYPRLAKRALDVTLAAVVLVAAAPLMLLIALLVRRSGPGAILFRQQRLGEGGEPFEILKFRTMIEHAEEPGQAVWARTDDPRVTPIGRRLRKWRLDELPQLWNVLRGEMSIVGPRPERPEFLERLENEVPFWTRRHLAKPGLTGWAQIRCGYTSDELSAADKLAYDLYYLKHQSVALDLAIAFRTARTVISGFGAR